MDLSGKQDDRLDRWLDGALCGYSNVSPLAGLENRILANLASAQEQRLSRAGWAWILAGSVALLAIAIASLSFSGVMHRSPPISTRNSAVHSPQLAETNDAIRRLPLHAPATVHAGAGIKAHRAEGKRTEFAAAPRLSQFPSPRQLSEQERLLKDFVRNSPEEAALVAQDQQERQHELETLIAEGSSNSESDQHER